MSPKALTGSAADLWLPCSWTTTPPAHVGARRPTAALHVAAVVAEQAEVGTGHAVPARSLPQSLERLRARCSSCSRWAKKAMKTTITLLASLVGIAACLIRMYLSASPSRVAARSRGGHAQLALTTTSQPAASLLHKSKHINQVLLIHTQLLINGHF